MESPVKLVVVGAVPQRRRVLGLKPEGNLREWLRDVLIIAEPRRRVRGAFDEFRVVSVRVGGVARRRG